MATFYAKAFPQGASAGGGVTSLNGETGAVVLVAGTGISVTPAGQNITIASTSAGDVTLAAVGSSPNANAATLTAQVLNLEPASGSFPGVVTTGTQTIAGAKTFTGVVLGSGGSVSAPAFSVNSADTNNGMYYVGTDQWALTAGSQAALQVRKSTGAFANVGMGGDASTSDIYPLLMQRDQSVAINAQLSNPNTDAASGAKWQLASSLGNSGGEVGLFSPATVAPDAYAGGNMTVRSTGTTAGIAYIADDSGAYHKFYVGGNAVGQKIATISSTGAAVVGAISATTTVTATTQLISSVATGTAPLVVSSTTQVANLNAATAGSATSATNATNTAITDDTTTNATMYPTWVTAATGNLPQKVSSTKLTFNPSTANLTTTTFTGALAGNATTSTTATNLAGGSGGTVPYQSAAGTTAMLANGTAGQYLKANGTTVAPSWASFRAPTVQKFTSGTSQTYTTPAGVLYIKVTAVGGGGGGSGSGTAGGTAAGDGGDTIFGTSLITAGGGIKGAFGGGTGGAGGSATATGLTGTTAPGTQGDGAAFFAINTTQSAGGHGGGNAYCGMGGPGGGAGNAAPAASTAGQGGGGGGMNGAVNNFSGTGGGGGGFVQAIITSPAGTYTYTVGAAGTAGAAGTSGVGGAAGGAGIIIVEEF